MVDIWLLRLIDGNKSKTLKLLYFWQTPFVEQFLIVSDYCSRSDYCESTGKDKLFVNSNRISRKKGNGFEIRLNVDHDGHVFSFGDTEYAFL